MVEGLVTVVLPIYKTEEYLNQCVESVVNQTYQNLEILLIDDGSPDNCPYICDEWAKKDSRIKVIHKENAGLGMARNTGIENANGEYICFFDSDDYVDEDTIKCAYEACKREQADIALFGFAISDSEGRILDKKVPCPTKNMYSGKEVQEAFLPDLIGTDPKTGKETNLCMSAWTMLYSVSLIKKNDWRFASERDIISEDVYSLLGLYQYVEKAVILERAFYVYRENRTSLTRSYRADRFDRVKEFYRACIHLCECCGYSQEVKIRCSEPFAAFVIALLKQEVAYWENRKHAVKRIREIVSDDLLQEVLRKKKHEKTGLLRKILFWAMRNRQYLLCYCMLKAKIRSEGR